MSVVLDVLDGIRWVVCDYCKNNLDEFGNRSFISVSIAVNLGSTVIPDLRKFLEIAHRKLARFKRRVISSIEDASNVEELDRRRIESFLDEEVLKTKAKFRRYWKRATFQARILAAIAITLLFLNITGWGTVLLFIPVLAYLALTCEAYWLFKRRMLRKFEVLDSFFRVKPSSSLDQEVDESIEDFGLDGDIDHD